MVNFSFAKVVAVVLAALLPYLLGSVSFAILYSQLFHHQDIRAFGSGNAGMTNVLRTYGKKAAAFVTIGDFCKGALGVVIARWLFLALGITFMDGGYIGGVFALLGHLFPIYFGFRGGKGVLTSAGVILVLNPVVVAILAVPALLLMFGTRYVSLGSVAAAVLFPFVTLAVDRVAGRPMLFDTLFAVLFGLVVLYMHRANIRRLLSGTENRFGQKKEGDPS